MPREALILSTLFICVGGTAQGRHPDCVMWTEPARITCVEGKTTIQVHVLLEVCPETAPDPGSLRGKGGSDTLDGRGRIEGAGGVSRSGSKSSPSVFGQSFAQGSNAVAEFLAWGVHDLLLGVGLCGVNGLDLCSGEARMIPCDDPLLFLSTGELVRTIVNPSVENSFA